MSQSIGSLENPALLANFKSLVREERRISREVLEYIAEIEKRRLYADEGFSSTHDWLVNVHGYSHASAGRRVSAARMLCAVPEAAVEIETGGLCMTTLSRVQSAIRIEERRTGMSMTPEQKSEVISEIGRQPKAEVERSLAEMFQFSAPRREIVEAKCDGETRTHLTFAADQMKKIERAAELLSHKLDGCGGSLASAIEAMADVVIAQKDPLVRVVKGRSKQLAKESVDETDAIEQTSRDAERSRSGVEEAHRHLLSIRNDVAISPSTRNAVYRRDSGCCQFETSDGRKCLSRKFTQIDHIHPRALGGSNEIENLRVLCRTHNLLMAERILGR